MVMYRDFAARTARKLGLVGEVWNERDGTVRIIAEGEEGLLNKLIIALKKGSVLARVDAVDTIWGDTQGSYEEFNIRYE